MTLFLRCIFETNFLAFWPTFATNRSQVNNIGRRTIMFHHNQWMFSKLFEVKMLMHNGRRRTERPVTTAYEHFVLILTANFITMFPVLYIAWNEGQITIQPHCLKLKPEDATTIPFISPLLFTITPALSSKYINVPSFLLMGFRCRITTAGITVIKHWFSKLLQHL